MLKEINNVKIQYSTGIITEKKGNTTEITCKKTTFEKPILFNTTLMIDNIRFYNYNLVKITVQKHDEYDMRLTLYSSMTKIREDILVPLDKDVVLVVGDNIW